MSTFEQPDDCPLTLGEARRVARQIREAKYADQQYWPWVIEELVRMIEELKAENPPAEE